MKDNASNSESEIESAGENDAYQKNLLKLMKNVMFLMKGRIWSLTTKPKRLY